VRCIFEILWVKHSKMEHFEIEQGRGKKRRRNEGEWKQNQRKLQKAAGLFRF